MSRETEREAWEGSLRGDKSRGKEKRNTSGRGGWGRKAEQKKRDVNLVEGVKKQKEVKIGKISKKIKGLKIGSPQYWENPTGKGIEYEKNILSATNRDRYG